jgi:hypothetical protein
MDVRVVEEQQKAAAQAVFRAVSRGSRVQWVRARLFWSEVGGSIGSHLAVWDADEGKSGVPVPDEVDEPLALLRRETERPGEGAWLSVYVTVTTEGRYSFEYNYDQRPSWTNSRDPLSGGPGGAPSDDSLLADLARHPRRPEALPAWYPVRRPAGDEPPTNTEPERPTTPLAPPPSVADLVAMPGWADVWQSVVGNVDRVLRPEVARQFARTPQAERVQETDDVVGDVWKAVWAERVTSLDAGGVVELWEPWARATGRDLALGSTVDPRADVGAPLDPNSPLDLVLQDVGDVVDTLTEAALDARIAEAEAEAEAEADADAQIDAEVDGDVRGLVVALAERGRLRVVEQPGTELAVGNGDTGFQVTASDLGFDVESTERGRARVRATASTLDLAWRVLLWELRVPVRAELGLERVAVSDDLASVPAGVDVEADTRAVTLSWRSAVGAEWVAFPGSGARRSAVGFSRVLGLGAHAVVDLVLDPDAPQSFTGA